MTSPIGAIGAIDSLSGINGMAGLGGIDAGAATPTAPAAPAAPNGDFGGMLAKGLENVQASQAKADDLAVKVADGTLQDPAQYTMAATEAQLGLQLTMAIRNKAVDAFQEIMRMQA